MTKTVAIFGASGGIGQAVLNNYLNDPTISTLYAFSRRSINNSHPKLQTISIDISDEASIQTACQRITEALDEVLICTGILEADGQGPEKSSKQLKQAQMTTLFQINTIGPSLILKHILPKLRPKSPSKCIVLSARVGSIQDNRLGGWYSYRASKAALNMIVKTAAIEQKRRHPEHIILAYHPGSVDTALSKSFQKNCVSTFFKPELAATYLKDVIEKLSPDDSGKLIAWDGSEIPA